MPPARLNKKEPKKPLPIPKKPEFWIIVGMIIIFIIMIIFAMHNSYFMYYNTGINGVI